MRKTINYVIIIIITRTILYIGPFPFGGPKSEKLLERLSGKTIKDTPTHTRTHTIGSTEVEN